MQAICIKSLDVFVFCTGNCNYTNLTQFLAAINTFGKETELLKYCSKNYNGCSYVR